MRQVTPDTTWPESWRYSHVYDLQEVYGALTHRGYAYAYDNRRRHTLSLLQSVLSPGARVLDIAAAQGNFSLLLAEAGYEVTWNDLRADLAEYVRLKQERGTIHFAPGNVFELGLAEVFDGVLATEIIEHVAHPDDFLAKLAKLVRPGGYIVLTTPNGAYVRNTLPKWSDCTDPAQYESVQFRPNADGHIFLLHPDELATLAVTAGLEVDHMVLFTNPLTAGHMKMEALLKLLPRTLVNGLESLTGQLPRPVAKRFQVQIGIRFRKP